MLECLHQGKKLSIDEESVYFTSLDCKPEGNLDKILENAKIIHLDEVKYVKRTNVGGKTRWYKSSKLTQGEDICKAQDIDSSARRYSLQAFLVDMDGFLYSEPPFQASTIQKHIKIPVHAELLF